MKKLNRNSSALLVTSAINNVIALFVNYFLVAHLLNISSQNISNVATFFLISYTFLGLGYFALSPLLEKINKLIFFRIGIVLKVCFVFLVMFLQGSLIEYLVIVAVFAGTADAFYWSSFNAMRNEIIDNVFFQNYISINTIINQIISILFPFLMGSAIDISSFRVIAILIFALAIVQLITSMTITHRTKPGKFELGKFFRKIKETNSQKMFKKLYLAYFIGGAKHAVTPLIVYIILLTFQTNTNLGILTSVFAFCSILTMIMFSKWYKPGKSSWVLIVVSGIIIISMGGLLFGLSKTTIILFNFAYTSFIVLPNSLSDLHRSTIVKKLNMHEFIVENMSIAELLLNMGRIVSFLSFFVVGIINTKVALNVLLGIIALAVAGFSLFIYLLEKDITAYNYDNLKLDSTIDPNNNN